MRSFFSEKQWRWVRARYQEGYTLVSLAAFLGVHWHTVQRGIARLDPDMEGDLPPLSSRRSEFLSL